MAQDYSSKKKELYAKHRHILFDFMDQMLAELANMGATPQEITVVAGNLVEHYAKLLEREFPKLDAQELMDDYIKHREQRQERRNGN